MSIGFFSLDNEKQQDLNLKLQELKGSFTDRVIERLNKVYDECKEQYEQSSPKSANNPES